MATDAWKKRTPHFLCIIFSLSFSCITQYKCIKIRYYPIRNDFFFFFFRAVPYLEEKEVKLLPLRVAKTDSVGLNKHYFNVNEIERFAGQLLTVTTKDNCLTRWSAGCDKCCFNDHSTYSPVSQSKDINVCLLGGCRWLLTSRVERHAVTFKIKLKNKNKDKAVRASGYVTSWKTGGAKWQLVCFYQQEKYKFAIKGM